MLHVGAFEFRLPHKPFGSIELNRPETLEVAGNVLIENRTMYCLILYIFTVGLSTVSQISQSVSQSPHVRLQLGAGGREIAQDENDLWLLKDDQSPEVDLSRIVEWCLRE